MEESDDSWTVDESAGEELPVSRPSPGGAPAPHPMDDEAVGDDFEMSEPDAFVEPPSSVDKGAYATPLPPPPPERALRMAASRGFAPDDLDLATGAVDDEVADEFEVSEEEEEEEAQ